MAASIAGKISSPVHNQLLVRLVVAGGGIPNTVFCKEQIGNSDKTPLI
jgi:hypothetical protein